jgi:hypothetical protein
MLEHALEECLTRMRLEGVSPEECLAQYPQYRDELTPLLQASLHLHSLDDLEPRPEFRAQTRAKLLEHMRANPRRSEPWFRSLAFKYAASLAILFVALTTTGTALAQSALPGDTLYGWKLASERIWYSLQQNPLDADIFLSTRRVHEIQTIKGMANLEEIGIGAYQTILQQLNQDLAANPDRLDNVSDLLLEQREMLREIIENSQANVPDLDELFGIVTLPSPPAQNEHPPADNNGNGNGGNPTLPAIVTALPSTKRDEGDQGASDDDDNQPPGPEGQSKGHEPGFLEALFNGIFGSH